MVPVGVRDEHRDVERLVAELAHQRLPEGANAGAGVENNDLIADADFDARGVAAEHRGLDAGRRNRTAHAPETHQRRPGHDWARLVFGENLFPALIECGEQVGRNDRFDQIIVRSGGERRVAVVREIGSRR